ncbi:MAG: amidohydrolase family protein [Propionibacteriaceae bacterium]|nr:amidohydrolase family protein [Propionibacteriaceae bacterium]
MKSDSSLSFFDTCMRIGRSRAPDPPGNVCDVPAVLACMDRHAITDAILEHAVAMEFSPRLGHEELARSIKGQPHLRPAWHLMPVVSDRIQKAVTDPQEFLDAGVALGRVDAKDFCHGRGDEAGFAPVLEACQAVHLPVFLDFRTQGSIMDFDFGICARWPGIPFVLEGSGGYPLHRTVWCLREYPNLHISTLGDTFNGVSLLCEAAGAERVLFGSNFPAQNIGMSLGCVVLADVSDADRRLIARGNMERLLGGISQ